MTVAYAWAPITKSEKQNDGTLVVYGPAASSALDRDQQRLSGDWLDAAMPRWLAEGGGVREQHDPKRAVGVGVGLSKADDGSHLLTAKIVDPVAVKKIEHGVLRGFSVGIKNPRLEMGKADAPNGLVVDGDVIEVSVVDRPANGECMFQLAKADAAGDLTLVEDPHVITKVEETETFGLPAELYDRLAAPVKEALAELAASGAAVSAEAAKADSSGDVPPVVVNVAVQAPGAGLDKADLSAAGRKKAAASGAAMSDGSYPINTKADLRKAIRAVGRGGAEHDAIRKHIVKRAKALGLEAMVPDNWNPDGSTATKADEGNDSALAETVTKAEQVLRDVRALAPALAKADGEDGASGGEGETGDIVGADQAIAVIAKLIIAEAESLAQGNLNEACDIDLLLSAVRSLAWFKSREEAEQEGGADAEMALADQPDIAKTDAPATPAVEPITQTSDASQAPDTVTKADVAELVKAAVAEATEAAKERENALAADLVKANAAIEEFRTMPVPGGPALTRTAAQQAQARSTDADRMRAEAKTLMVKADSAVDPVLRKGYTDRANELLEKADA
jgi:hypothetical protein